MSVYFYTQNERSISLYEKDVKTFYGMLNTNIQKVDLTVLYGTTDFTPRWTNKRDTQDEISVWVSYPFTKELSGTLVYDRTFKGSSSIPDVEQFSLWAMYNF